jgi:hypothetical protein
MIGWTCDGDPVSLDAPRPGLWVARHNGSELARVEVSLLTLVRWGRLCALAVSHLLPDGTDPVVREWLETGSPTLCAGTWVAARCLPKAHALEAAQNAAEAAFEETLPTWKNRRTAMTRASVAAYCARRAAPHICTQVKLLRLVWEAHGNTLSLRARLELGRELRHLGEHVAGDAVVPPEFRAASA